MVNCKILYTLIKEVWLEKRLQLRVISNSLEKVLISKKNKVKERL